MTQEKKPATSTAKLAERAVWERPELRRMAAGEAEALFTSGNDGATQS